MIGGASADTLDARLHWTRRMTALGCDGVLVSPPFDSEEQYAAEVRQLAAQKPGFLMLQDWSSTGTGVPVEVLARLFEDIPCFKCLKIEVASSGPKYTQVLAATDGRLHVSGGWAVTEMMDGLDRGVHAFMPTGLHWTYTRIHRLYEQGNRAAAQVLFERLRPVLNYANQDLPCSIHFFKQLLHAQGIYATARIRQPLSNSIDEARCRDMTALALMLEYELGAEHDV